MLSLNLLQHVTTPGSEATRSGTDMGNLDIPPRKKYMGYNETPIKETTMFITAAMLIIPILILHYIDMKYTP
jgi:hypothetical protein